MVKLMQTDAVEGEPVEVGTFADETEAHAKAQELSKEWAKDKRARPWPSFRIVSA